VLLSVAAPALAMAQREVGSRPEMPPPARGYTQSVFSRLPGGSSAQGRRTKGRSRRLHGVLAKGTTMNERSTTKAPIDYRRATRAVPHGCRRGHFPALDPHGVNQQVRRREYEQRANTNGGGPPGAIR